MAETPATQRPDDTRTASDVVAKILVDTGAVSFRTDPFFTFTSGTESPVYVDNRRLLGFPVERRQIVAELAGVTDAGVTAVAGTATAGIAWAAWLADRLELPMLYVRSQAKEHGQQRAIEGTAPEGSETVLVEDLAFTAGSMASSAANLREAGFVVDVALTIVSYETPKAAERIGALGIEHRTLTTIDAALAAAEGQGALDAAQVAIVQEWIAGIREG
jgi:orotate phosphoribosyltransferase